MDIKYGELLIRLEDIKNSQKVYRNPKVINTKLKFFGIYVPTLKKLAKEYKNANFINFKFDEIYEINVIYAYANLLRLEGNLKEQFKFINDHDYLFDTWASVDLCAPLLKDADIQISKKFINSKNEFVRRFGYVILLPQVRNHKMINEVFNIIIEDNRYYVIMAEGWLLSECLITSFDESLKLLKSSNISNEIKLIAIQKAIDSLRVNDKNKDILRDYRKFMKGVNDDK